ncbi:hypothetical protein CL689_05975 [Candidatus Saccharibacteria bacterium]|mgnify:CR=1 FL=1|nr:hypothetical protein [Candidatus Saccharibacteria bacterium]|tara:strand:+ start:3838 stop:4245 length:408 start_codon:yes stop_codon:yes gene_type:complete
MFNRFSDEALAKVDSKDLPNPFDFPFELTRDTVVWAEKINLFSGDISSLKSELTAKISSAPSDEAASYVFDLAFEMVKKKITQLDLILTRRVPLNKGHLLKFAEVKHFAEQKEELLALLSDENRSHPFIEKVFGT